MLSECVCVRDGVYPNDEGKYEKVTKREGIKNHKSSELIKEREKTQSKRRRKNIA